MLAAAKCRSRAILRSEFQPDFSVGLFLAGSAAGLAYSASWLTTLSAIFVKVASVFFSSSSVASRHLEDPAHWPRSSKSRSGIFHNVRLLARRPEGLHQAPVSLCIPS